MLVSTFLEKRVLYRVTSNAFERIPQTSFAQENVRERQDLQRLLRADISVISPDLMVIAEEFSQWEDSSRRIDLLCLDTDARLVVVEIKRSDDGGHMELQAIRYAAMISAMTLEQLVGAHARYIGGDEAFQKAESAILSFLGLDSTSSGALTGEVRIILISADFSRELTTSVIWLKKLGLDITCVRLRPYRADSGVFVDVQQIIPLPEAADYETKLRAQKDEANRATSIRHEARLRFWTQLIARARGRTAVLANKSPTTSNWLGSAVRRGFFLNFVLLQDECRVECYIDLGLGSEDATTAAFRALEAQKAQIEAKIGKPLFWQPLEQSRACRISTEVEGGWKTPETTWASLQDNLIDAMVRFESAMKPLILELKP